MPQSTHRLKTESKVDGTHPKFLCLQSIMMVGGRGRLSFFEFFVVLFDFVGCFSHTLLYGLFGHSQNGPKLAIF